MMRNMLTPLRLIIGEVLDTQTNLNRIRPQMVRSGTVLSGNRCILLYCMLINNINWHCIILNRVWALGNGVLVQEIHVPQPRPKFHSAPCSGTQTQTQIKTGTDVGTHAPNFHPLNISPEFGCREHFCLRCRP